MRGLIAFAAFVGFMLWLLVAAAGDALAGDVYMWTTEDGVYSFTDDPRAIPKRYQAAAKPMPLEPLRSYPKLTTADGARPDIRLDYLRRANMAAFLWRYHPRIAAARNCCGCR